MLDFRYHIFYLGLMFLMLGFGVFIGASLTAPALMRQQTNAIKALRGEANQVVQERDQTRDRAQKDETGLNALRPALVHNRLKGRHVVIVQTGEYSDATEAASSALSDAGATVTATVVLPDKWDALSPGQRTAMMDTGGFDTNDAAEMQAMLLHGMVTTLVHGTANHPASGPAVPAMQAQGLMTISGDVTAPCAFFVLVGGHTEDGGGLEAAVLDGFKALSPAVTVVGCEPYSAAASSIPAFQAAGISTVDCVDLPLGQIALPLALRGDRGDYGLKPTADQTLPTFTQTEAAAP